VKIYGLSKTRREGGNFVWRSSKKVRYGARGILRGEFDQGRQKGQLAEIVEGNILFEGQLVEKRNLRPAI
jgi:hypothetical protein